MCKAANHLLQLHIPPPLFPELEGNLLLQPRCFQFACGENSDCNYRILPEGKIGAVQRADQDATGSTASSNEPSFLISASQNLIPENSKMFFRSLQSTTVRYISLYPYSPISAFPFSTLEIPSHYISNQSSETHVKNPINIDESCVLNQLSDILPINRDPSIFQPITGNLTDKHLEIKDVDEFLAPEEKLRGIFLQRLRGKTAIRHALSSVGVEVNMDIFSKVMNRGNLCGEAMVMFFDWAIEQPNIRNGILSYHIILKALGRRKFYTYMMEILNDMRAKDVNPNPETLFIVMDSYIRAGQVSKAIKFFGELEKYGLKVNVETMNVLLRCLCHRSYVGTASSLFNRMKDRVRPDIETYNIIIGGWSKFGRVEEVEKFLQVMVNNVVEHDCVTYRYILEGMGRAGRVDNSVKIFEYLEEKRTVLSTEVYNAMVFNFIAVGDIDEGLKYYERMLSNNYEPNMDTYARIISAFLKVRRVSDAIALFDEMLARGIIPTSGTLTTFIKPLCSYGPPHAALMIYKKARKVGCKISVNAYKLLLMRLSRFGKCGMLLSIWEEMQESGYSCDMQAYEYVINGLCNTGQLETAVLVMEESLHKGFFPSKFICSKLNNKLLDSNKVEIAYKLFLKLKNARVDENAQRYWRAKGWHF